jgi:hypothetical protein
VLVAVRTNNPPEETNAPAPASSTGFFTQLLIIAFTLAFGFGINSFMTALQEKEQVTTEYRGYRDAIKDVR